MKRWENFSLGVIFLLCLMCSCKGSQEPGVREIDVAIIEDTAGTDVVEYHLWTEIKFLDENNSPTAPAEGVIRLEVFFETASEAGTSVLAKEVDKEVELNEKLLQGLERDKDWMKTGRDHTQGKSIFLHIKSGIRPATAAKKASVTVTYKNKSAVFSRTVSR